MRRLQGWYLVGTIGLMVTSGCMMPAYRYPAGFSSTFQRHLYAGDPRAMPHEPASRHIEPVPNEPPRVFVPDAELMPPEKEQTAPQSPGVPIDPGTHPSPPAPLPEDSIDSPIEGPSAGPARDDKILRANFRKFLSNTGMSLPR